ncbi:MAG: DUF2813 domain-containing protein [Kiritimatiellae bacterium]|nr:DUF2813 domain-containing protein [Kiritimatiellia bacterium]
MLLKDIKIRNFRGIDSLEIPLDKVTVLIGENNTGKSTILAALQMVLLRGFASRRDGCFTDYDFHLRDERATPQSAEPISIELHIAEDTENEWPDEVVQYLSEMISPDPLTGLNHIWLKASGRFDASNGNYITECTFLNPDHTEKNCKSLQCHSNLARYLPIFFLSAIRDAANEFGRRGQFWSGFMKSIQMTEEDQRLVEEALKDVNERVIGANAGLHTVVEQLERAKGLVPIAEETPVVLEAVPTKAFDLTGRIQVSLKSKTGVKLPLSLHGEGTRSISVLMLFRAFVATLLKEVYTQFSTPLLLLEEPEAHLHPSAIRSLGKFICETSSQVVVTSHSGDLIAKVPLGSIRRCYKVGGETKIGRIDVGQFDDKELKAIEYSLREDRGRYLFSRCWLLVEGETDFHVFKQLMEHLNLSEDDLNVSILEFSQRRGKGEFFIKLAKMLGIEWFLVADTDAQGTGTKYIQMAQAHLSEGETLSQRAKQWMADIEEEFWNNGFAEYIDSLVVEPGRSQLLRNVGNDEQARKRALIDGATSKKMGGKPALAEKLVAEIQRRGSPSIPASVKSVIDRVVELAKG